MSVSRSKYASKKPKKEINPWVEMTISEEHMTEALRQYPVMKMSTLSKTKEIERIVVGDLANGLYPLAVLVSKRKERD